MNWDLEFERVAPVPARPTDADPADQRYEPVIKIGVTVEDKSAETGEAPLAKPGDAILKAAASPAVLAALDVPDPDTAGATVEYQLIVKARGITGSGSRIVVS